MANTTPYSTRYSLQPDEEKEQQQEVVDKNNTPKPDEEKKQQSVDKNNTPINSYDTIISSINKELSEMKDRNKKNQRLDAVVAAINSIGDVGRAIGNMYAARHYVPIQPSHNNYSDKYRDRAAILQQQYEKDRQAMMNHLYKVEEQKQTFNFNQEKQKLAREKWEKEEESKNALNQAKVENYKAMTQYREAIANKNYALAKKYEADVLYLQAKQKYLELGYNLKQAESQARIDADEALAEKRRREGNGTTTSTTIERDLLGNEVSRTTTKTPNGGGNGSNKKTAAL